MKLWKLVEKKIQKHFKRVYLMGGLIKMDWKLYSKKEGSSLNNGFIRSV